MGIDKFEQSYYQKQHQQGVRGSPGLKGDKGERERSLCGKILVD